MPPKKGKAPAKRAKGKARATSAANPQSTPQEEGTAQDIDQSVQQTAAEPSNAHDPATTYPATADQNRVLDLSSVEAQRVLLDTRALRQYDAQHQHRPGNEPDPAIQRYGTPGEGFHAQGETNETIRELHRVRYQGRRNLAELEFYPEGFQFPVRIGGANGEQIQTVTLLTPPNMVAVHRADGSWFRRARDLVLDGPPPYGNGFYEDYLQHNQLPTYFMRRILTVILDQDEEATALGIVNRSTRNDRPGRNYLLDRFPAQPLNPQPAPSGQAYSHVMLPHEMLQIARRFPAALVAARLNRPLMFVLDSGHIHFTHPTRDPPIPCEEVGSDAMQWSTDEQARPVASYYLPSRTEQELQDLMDAQEEAENAAIGRQVRIADIEARGGFINPAMVPNGGGRTRFLTQDDERRARALGFTDPGQVTEARQQGALGPGTTENAGPTVYFVPDRRYFNPDQQPEGPGRFEYWTEGDGSSEYHAHVNLGGQDHFPETARPTAAQVAELRYRSRAAGAMDPTEGVDLVWIPSQDDDPEIIQSAEFAQSSEQDQTVSADMIDQYTGLQHDPLNGGVNDQTGTPGRRRLYTRNINGQNVTVDRSTARINVPEPHKRWVVNDKGVWKPWKGGRPVNWNSARDIYLLNKWRDQFYGRKAWAAKREKKREDYTREQDEWFFEWATKYNGENPPRSEMTFPELTRLFNERFNDNREESGISNALGRARKDFKENNGQMRMKPGRAGQKRKKADATEKAEAEGEEVGDGDNASEDSFGEGPSKRRKVNDDVSDAGNGDEAPNGDAEDLTELDADEDDGAMEEDQEADGDGDDDSGYSLYTDK